MARRFGRLLVAALLLGVSFAVPRASEAESWTTFVTTSSSAVKISGNGLEPCTAANIGTFRKNPATGRIQLCK